MVSTWGRRRSPRSSALTAWTDRPAIVASSSCVNPAASRSALSCAPNDRGAPTFMLPILPPPVRASYGRCAGAVGGHQFARPHTGGMAFDPDAKRERMTDSPARDVPATGESFDEVVLPHLDAAYRLARWLMRNEHDAEDVVQEASLRALRYFRTFAGGNGRAWFLRIVRNTCCWLARPQRPSTHRPVR